MNTIDFTKAGGFLLEQETLEMIQDTYAEDLFKAFKRQLGVKEVGNYTYKKPTLDTKGWLSIEGTLITVLPTETITDFIEVQTIREALVFGSGVSEKIYIRYEANYVDQIPITLPSPEEDVEKRIDFSYYSMADFVEVTNIEDLYKHLLPLEGSETMRGDLNLGGNKISNLDIKEQQLAKIRAAAIFFGETTQGKILEDEGSKLTINKEARWQTTKLYGKPRFKKINENKVTHHHTFVVDHQGNVSKSIGSYIGGIPLGLILVWNTDEAPYGWVFCDGNNGKTIQGVTIPDLRNYFKGTTRYIIYVRYTNRPPEGLVIEGETQLTYAAEEGSANTTLIASAVDPDGDALNYHWTMLSGSVNISEVHTPQIDLSGLTAGTYLFNVSASDQEELKIETTVAIEVTRLSETSLSLNRWSDGVYKTIETYDINIEGAPNQTVQLFGKIEENSSVGSIYIFVAGALQLTSEVSFPVTLDATGKTSFVVSAGAGDIIGVTRGTIQIEGDESSKVFITAERTEEL